MKEKYIEDLKEIRDIMNRSTWFVSLSGLSGISAGIAALAGVFLAYQTIFKEQEYLVYDQVSVSFDTSFYLLMIALGTLITATITAIFFTSKKSGKETVWNEQTKRQTIHLSIPLFTGGLVCLTLLLKGFIGLLPPFSLIFYGLALVNGSKYTYNEIRSLGIIEILLGLVSLQFIDSGLLFWAIGFGVLHIIYGVIVQWKYKS